MVSGEWHTNFVEGPNGEFTESFDDMAVALLVRLGLVEFVREGHLIVKREDDQWVGSGPATRFYAPPGVVSRKP